MKKSYLKIALLFALPLTLVALSLKPLTAESSTAVGLYQGSDLDSRLQAVEKRINALKQSVSTKSEYKSHRGAVATLENRKNTLKASIKTGPKNNAARPQLEQDMKALEDKVAELENQIK